MYRYYRFLIVLVVIAMVLSFTLGFLNARKTDDISDIPGTPEIAVEVQAETVTPRLVTTRTCLGTFKLTAYCPCSKCCGEWADGITYTGTVATEGRTIAVDPDVIPLGSRVEINGHEYIAEDIGGAVKENKIDIFFNSHEDALNFGVSEATVFLVEEAIIYE